VVWLSSALIHHTLTSDASHTHASARALLESDSSMDGRVVAFFVYGHLNELHAWRGEDIVTHFDHEQSMKIKHHFRIHRLSQVFFIFSPVMHAARICTFAAFFDSPLDVFVCVLCMVTS
jgi:hypothetical protein